jgi:hypothetical protein
MTTSEAYLRRAAETEELARQLSRDDHREEARKLAEVYRRRASELAERERSFRRGR